MNYSELIAKLDAHDSTVVQKALDMRQEILDQIAPEMRKLEKLEAALKAYAKEIASEDGGQVIGSGNVMKITVANIRVVSDTAQALSWMESQKIDPSQYVTISVEKTQNFLPAEFVSSKPSVRVSFK